jgi:hypothetical protein
MRGVVIVPGPRSDVLWLDDSLGMNWSTFNDLWNYSTVTIPPSGTHINLSGTFRSPPAGVCVGDGLEVFGLNSDYVLLHKSYDPGGQGGWSAEWENLGGELTSTPVAVSTAGDQLDIFVLGADQGLLHRLRSGGSWSDWVDLGGCFTSAPVVLPAGPDTFDIFARGPDYLIYHSELTASGPSEWASLGAGLLREPIATSAPAAVRVHDQVYVFVVAEDRAIWFTRFDGRLWRPWSSLGGTFLFDPVALALFPEISTLGTYRIDVFGISYEKFVLMHNWLVQGGVGNEGWHGWVADSNSNFGDPVDLGPNPPYHRCTPGIVAPQTAPRPVISGNRMPPVAFQIVMPDTDLGVSQRLFQDGVWQYHGPGPEYRLPATYRFGIIEIDISSTRSWGEGSTDTDYAALTFGAGALAPQSNDFSLGDMGSGHNSLSQAGYGDPDIGSAELPDVTVDLCEPAAITWSIVNSSKGDNETRLITSALIKLMENTVDGYVKGKIKVAGAAVGGALGGPIGALAGMLASALIDSVVNYIFTSCDGIVSVGSIAYPTGWQLQKAVLESPDNKLTASTRYIGDNPPPPGNCNVSNYNVTWYIRSN